MSSSHDVTRYSKLVNDFQNDENKFRMITYACVVKRAYKRRFPAESSTTSEATVESRKTLLAILSEFYSNSDSNGKLSIVLFLTLNN